MLLHVLPKAVSELTGGRGESGSWVLGLWGPPGEGRADRAGQGEGVRMPEAPGGAGGGRYLV